MSRRDDRRPSRRPLRVATALAAGGLLLLAGCAAPSSVPANASICPSTPPVGCSDIHIPVCGYKKDGTSATYDNACRACVDGSVSRFVQGRCPAG